MVYGFFKGFKGVYESFSCGCACRLLVRASFFICLYTIVSL